MNEFFLGDRLKAAINAAGTNQSVLAKDIGIKVQSVQQCAEGRACFAGETIKKAAECLNISEKWLASGELSENISETECVAAVSLAMSVMNLKELSAMRMLADVLVDTRITHKSGRDKTNRV